MYTVTVFQFSRIHGEVLMLLSHQKLILLQISQAA